MGYRISYYQQVLDDDIPALPETIKKRVKQAIEERLLTNPDMYGKPLRKGLSGFRKLRIGDWRIIYGIEGENVTILLISHRSKVYQVVFHRLPAP
mgnify:CR=1 FL=1